MVGGRKKKFVNENSGLGMYIESRKEVSLTLSRELTTTIDLDSIIHFSGSEFGYSSLVVESWLAI